MKSEQPAVEFHPRPRYVDELILVDGITRAGKFLLGHVVSAMEGVEFLQYPPLLEMSLYLVRLGKLDPETAKILVHTDIDLNTYNMMIGRGLNGRMSDLSCIHKAADAERFLARATVDDPDALVAEVRKENRLPLYIGHETMANAGILFDIYPKIRVISLQRDPIALIWSWYRRGWGRRIGHDPKSMAIGFTTETGPVPWWFAFDAPGDYYGISEMDRVVHSIERLSDLAKEEFEALTPAQKKQVHFVAFEDIITNPQKVIAGLGRYLGKAPHRNIDTVLRRERIPREVPSNLRAATLEDIRKEMSPGLEPVLKRLADDYDNYWMKMIA